MSMGGLLTEARTREITSGSVAALARIGSRSWSLWDDKAGGAADFVPVAINTGAIQQSWLGSWKFFRSSA